MTFKSIGSDMELFAKNTEGKHIPLCGMIGGTKENPLQIASLPDGFFKQEDNVAFEFNIPVCTTKKQFIDSFSIMYEEVKRILTFLNLEISPACAVSFDKTLLTHPQALVFGCEPDYNVWKRKENPKPEAKDENLRTCGGHVHVGTENDMVVGIQNMDLFLGVPSVILDTSPGATLRREIYGKAGAMRPKPYGFEYRVLSNFWWATPMLVGWVYENTRYAMKKSKSVNNSDATKIQECINNGDKVLAEKLIKKFEIPLPNEKPAEIPKPKIYDHFFKSGFDSTAWIKHVSNMNVGIQGQQPDVQIFDDVYIGDMGIDNIPPG